MSFGGNQSDPEQRRHAMQLKAWVREVAQLGEDATVVVTELRCTEPGCAPVETVMAVMRAEGTEQRKLPAPIAAVTREAVRHAWVPAPRQPAFPNPLARPRAISEEELRRLLGAGAKIERWPSDVRR